MFTIDNFYHDSVYGVVKFVGYHNGNLLFDRWEKSFVATGPGSGWHPIGQRVNIEPRFQESRLQKGNVRPILPPQ